MEDLLKEAIADAKAVRETALANAKAALEEAFAPKLQSMLNATLQNEAEIDESELDEMSYTTEMNSEMNPAVTDMATTKVRLNPDGTPMTPEQMAAADAAAAVPGIEAESINEDEFSLESIVKELEEEAASVDAGDVVSEDNATVAENKHMASLEEEEVEEEVNLEELINELKQEYTEATATSNEDEEELTEVKKNLQEHREVIKFLRSKLNEVNLLNAKLLFTNKLFKKHSMNESQKLKVIETLDRAVTLKECKLVYSTLEETFDGMKNSARKTAPRKIVESIASKPIASTKPSEETVKTVINEGVDLAERFKKLAGITK